MARVVAARRGQDATRHRLLRMVGPHHPQLLRGPAGFGHQFIASGFAFRVVGGDVFAVFGMAGRDQQRRNLGQQRALQLNGVVIGIRQVPEVGQQFHRVQKALRPQRAGLHRFCVFGGHAFFAQQAFAVGVGPFAHQRVQPQVAAVVQQRAGVKLGAQHLQPQLQRALRLLRTGRVGKGALESVAAEKRQPFADVRQRRPGGQRGQEAIDPFKVDVGIEAGEACAGGVKSCQFCRAALAHAAQGFDHRFRPQVSCRNCASRSAAAARAAGSAPTCTPCPGWTPLGTSSRKRTGAVPSKPWYAPA